MATTDFLFYFQ